MMYGHTMRQQVYGKANGIIRPPDYSARPSREDDESFEIRRQTSRKAEKKVDFCVLSDQPLNDVTNQPPHVHHLEQTEIKKAEHRIE